MPLHHALAIAELGLQWRGPRGDRATGSALDDATEDFAGSNIHRCDFGHPCKQSAKMPFAVLVVPAAEASSMAPPFVAGTFREARKEWGHAIQRGHEGESRMSETGEW